MRISDWSADVCSSDLSIGGSCRAAVWVPERLARSTHIKHRYVVPAAGWVLLLKPIGGLRRLRSLIAQLRGWRGIFAEWRCKSGALLFSSSRRSVGRADGGVRGGR